MKMDIRKPDQCDLHISGTSLKYVKKFKYLEVIFMMKKRINWQQDLLELVPNVLNLSIRRRKAMKSLTCNLHI